MTKQLRSEYWDLLVIAGCLSLILAAFAFLPFETAHAGPAAAPCRTAAYRTRVVNVLGTSEDLLAATNGAYKALKIGHVKAARQALRSVHDFLPTYFYREGRLVNMTTGCGI